jgi:hypothetical protein
VKPVPVLAFNTTAPPPQMDVLEAGVIVADGAPMMLTEVPADVVEQPLAVTTTV